MVTSFFGEYRFLSNFYPSPVKGFEFDGTIYPTVEHAFQAAKTEILEERETIRNSDTPGKAKRLGRKVTLIPNWNEIKVHVMKVLVKEKFEGNLSLQAQLLATGDEALQEGNTWGDRFWGVDLNTGVGENCLGQILMQVRSDLKK